MEGEHRMFGSGIQTDRFKLFNYAESTPLLTWSVF